MRTEVGNVTVTESEILFLLDVIVIGQTDSRVGTCRGDDAGPRLIMTFVWTITSLRTAVSVSLIGAS